MHEGRAISSLTPEDGTQEQEQMRLLTKKGDSTPGKVSPTTTLSLPVILGKVKLTTAKWTGVERNCLC